MTFQYDLGWLLDCPAVFFYTFTNHPTQGPYKYFNIRDVAYDL